MIRLAPFLLATCVAQVPALDGDLSGGTGGSWIAPVEVEPDLPPETLDVPEAKFSPCDAVDILFVIDNSGSMADNIESLSRSAATFVDAILTMGAGIDGGVHVGVVTTEPYYQNPPECTAMGRLVTRGATCECEGEGLATNEDCACCGLRGSAFLTDEHNIEEGLPCLLSLRIGGGDEKPSEAAHAALESWVNMPGQCNDGFHRIAKTTGDMGVDRAGLVLVYVTDEDDHTPGPPEAWVEYLTYLRGGDLNDTILVAIAGGNCVTEKPDKIQEMVDLMPHAFIGTICSSDFGPVLADALPSISAGCNLEYDPAP